MSSSIQPRAPGDPNVVMRAGIIANDDHLYSVAFVSRDDRAGVAEELLLRFVVHGYARILYELARVGQVRDLPARIDLLTAAEPRRDPDCFAIAGVRGKLVDVVASPTGGMSLTLERTFTREYALGGEVSLRGRILAYSMLAVVQQALREVSSDMATTILAALANMNASYRVQHRHDDPRAYREVPSIACKAAAFV